MTIIDVTTLAFLTRVIFLQGLEAHRYKNTVDCAFQILKHEGPQA